MVNVRRIFQHALAEISWRRSFSPPVLKRIGEAVKESEKHHGGEICFVMEPALSWEALWKGQSPRHRAAEIFARTHVWDTEHNVGVLIYVLLGDRDVEILSDRGLNGKVSPAEWESVCQTMEKHFRTGLYEEGALAGLTQVTQLMARHSPPTQHRPNELPDSPRVVD